MEITIIGNIDDDNGVRRRIIQKCMSFKPFFLCRLYAIINDQAIPEMKMNAVERQPQTGSVSKHEYLKCFSILLYPGRIQPGTSGCQQNFLLSESLEDILRYFRKQF